MHMAALLIWVAWATNSQKQIGESAGFPVRYYIKVLQYYCRTFLYVLKPLTISKRKERYICNRNSHPNVKPGCAGILRSGFFLSGNSYCFINSFSSQYDQVLRQAIG